MIVRINQLDPLTAEHASGWEAGTLRGAVDRTWSEDTLAYQVLILDYDEQNEPLSSSDRREQVRQILPKVIDAICGPQDQVVVRFDGPFTAAGVAPAFAFAADLDRCTRFSYSACDQLADRAESPVTSIRLFPRVHHRSSLCLEPRMSLYPAVRLRAFGIADELVDPLLDTTDLDDERWRELLPGLSFMVSTSSDLLSLFIWTSQFNADQIRRRITDHLGGKESFRDAACVAL